MWKQVFVLQNLGFPIFSPISKRQWVPGDSDVVGHRGNFFNGKVFRNWNGTLPTYIEVPKKNSEQNFKCKIFHCGPLTLGLFSKWVPHIWLKIAHLAIFRHKAVVGELRWCLVGQGDLFKKWRLCGHCGLRN